MYGMFRRTPLESLALDWVLCLHTRLSHCQTDSRFLLVQRYRAI